MNNCIISNDGWLVNLNYVVYIGPVEAIYNNANTKHVGYGFVIDTVNKDPFQFDYKFLQYKETPEELKIKVENIRMEILKKTNNDIMPTEVLPAIKLNKK